MKMFRNVMLLAMVLALAFMVACGEAEEPAAPPAGGMEAPPPGAETPPADDDPITAAPARDLEGREITIALWFDYWPWAERDAEEPDPTDPGDFYTNYRRWSNAQEVQDRYNFAVNPTLILEWNVLPVLTTSVLAGDPVADIVRTNNAATGFAAVIGGLATPGSQFAGPETDLMTNHHYVRPGITFEGEVWSFLDGAPHSGRPLAVNLDMIAELGLENPADLFDRGEWTWDAMREMMILATRDTDGDGVVDNFGISGQPSEILQMLLGANDGFMVIEEDRSFGLDHPRSITALEFLFEMLNTLRVYNYDQVENSLGHYSRQMWVWTEGSTLFFPAELWMLNEGINDRGAAFNNYTVVPFPIGPDNSGSYVYLRGWPNSNIIPMGVVNPQDVYFAYEEIRSWPREDTWLVREPYLENVARVALQTEEDVQRVMNHVAGQGKIDLGFVVPNFMNIVWDMQGAFFNGTETVAQALEARRGEGQALIDAAFADN